MDIMRIFLLFSAILITTTIISYEFRGTHYIASYKGCKKGTLLDNTWVYIFFLNGVLESHATILHHYMHTFEPSGMTATAILSESHASIHTYPEHDAVFVDLFTCGDSCDWHGFEAVMCEYLQPEYVERKVMVRE